ncbi:MAG: putative metal-dependent hydrolase [Rhodothermales bacterium]|nr:putative metal-dependent hydrolase [Rhodothermales bacterium]
MPADFSDAAYDAAVDSIRRLPVLLSSATKELTDEQLKTPYRPGGWTVRQVVHHIADSHINAYVRVKWALTENLPTIKTYDEVEWANLFDGSAADIDVSLRLVDALHRRWSMLLAELSEGQRSRTITHPEWGAVTVDYLVAQYAWHGKHHVAHITSLSARRGWVSIEQE